MKYHCTPTTDLHELIGQDSQEGFQYGPLSTALKTGDELILEESHFLSRLMLTKIQAIIGGLFIVETEETLRASAGFRILFH